MRVIVEKAMTAWIGADLRLFALAVIWASLSSAVTWPRISKTIKGVITVAFDLKRVPQSIGSCSWITSFLLSPLVWSTFSDNFDWIWEWIWRENLDDVRNVSYLVFLVRENQEAMRWARWHCCRLFVPQDSPKERDILPVGCVNVLVYCLACHLRCWLLAWSWFCKDSR